jgi:hypothetical protein
MGQVALTAGYYLMSRLHMQEVNPLPTRDLYDVDHIDVKEGLIQSGRAPQNRLFLWKDPRERHDIVVLIGESQPPVGKYTFCRRLLDYAESMKIQDVFTFAALGTDMQPKDGSRVFGIATDLRGLKQLRREGVGILTEGQISGLNGVFLGAAAERGIRGIGLLGEMPTFAAQVPFPSASRAVLEVFARMGGIDIDLRELEEYGNSMEGQLSTLLDKMREALQERTSSDGGEQPPPAEPDKPEPPLPFKPRLDETQRRRIEELFQQASRDRSKTFELKRELDLRGAFKEYEDRFLDLFRKAG